MLAADSRPENLRSATAGRSFHHAPAAVPDLCASLPASAPRFRPAALCFRFSMVCGKTSLSRRKWLSCGGGFGAWIGEGAAAQRAGRRSGAGPSGTEVQTSRRASPGWGPTRFSVLILRGLQPLSAVRSVSAGENTRCCSSVGPHRVASR